MSSGKKDAITGYTSGNVVSLIKGGKPYFDHLISMIRSATESIHLQTYIYDDDETGRLVADALIEAAGRRVEVYVIADGYASRSISATFLRLLSHAGIRFRFFNPILRSRYFYLGRRLHHKIAVVDGRRALAGGINISNRYNDMPGTPAWLDFALYVEGQAANELCILCWKTWNNFANMSNPPCQHKEQNIHTNQENLAEVRLCRNDWVRRKNEISSTYVNMFRNAKSEIIILCSYFLPGSMIRRHMADAARRGVKIKIITAGISDILIAKYAERYMYDWILKNNMELYEYQDNILHGKIAVCDRQWLTIGSYNINNISAYASIELNMNVRNTVLAEKTAVILEQIINHDSIPVTKEWVSRNRNPIRRFIQWISHEFIRSMLYVFTFYFKHKT